ncbi:hypothetical protein WJX72_010661 [[Myrmecia] bisecta]|uniref:JmjC domain-containing protein n=1 Tax=[Myrmecia] bisecta TaxID=41462 RepID=A0AAW1R9J9_9CHLO
MHICLDEHSDKLCWQGSWKRTALFHSSPSGAAAQGPVCPLPVAAPVGFHSLFLYRRWYRCHLDVRGFWPPQQQVPRVSGADLSLEQFTAEYDQRSSPVMLTGLTQGWKASAWDVQSLVAEYRDVCFQASKPAGGNVPMTLRDYMAYAVAQQDEEPLYVFDKGFGEAAPVMLQAYEVPKVFPEDLFAGLGYKRPSFRWLVAGPPRSGAAWHVDPTLTSAWNALLAGRKRWALYPPHRIPPGINFHVDEEGEVDFDTPSSLRWFLEVYPELTEGQRPLEILQEPGEVIFVPGGWWHCVLNLDHSIALTQNAISAASLAGAVDRVVSDEGDGYSALSSLPADMLPKVTGFRRSKLVGPWLHDLWAQKPELQGTIWRAAQQHLAVEHWQRRLGRVCTAHGLPGPSQQQCLPVGGGESLVFALDGLVVKFYANPDYTVALFMWEVERSLYQTIAQHPVPLQAITPRLVASGICSDERQLNAASSLSEAVRIASERHPAAIQAASCNGGRFLPPVWLHGDLTPENVLLAGPLASLDGRAGNLRLLDFADGGHGDALYDLVALFISTLQCVPARLKAFLEAYGGVPDLAEQGSGEHVAAENGPVQAPDAQMLARGGDGAGQGGDGCRGTVDADGQPVARQGAVAGRKQAAAQRTQALAVEADAGKEVAWRRPGTSSLAYRCMVYTLLHDQDMFARVLEKQPQLAMLDSWQAVAESLWGQVGFALA